MQSHTDIPIEDRLLLPLHGILLIDTHTPIRNEASRRVESRQTKTMLTHTHTFAKFIRKT